MIINSNYIAKSTRYLLGMDVKSVKQMQTPEIVAEMKAGATGPRLVELKEEYGRRMNEMVPSGNGRSMKAGNVSNVTKSLLGWR